MKKSLLLLFTLLIFVGNVWGDYTCTLYSAEQTINRQSTHDLNLGSNVTFTAISFEVKAESKWATADFYVGTADGSKNIADINPSNTSYKTITGNPASGQLIYFKNKANIYKRYIKNVTLTIPASSHNFEAQVGSSSEWTTLYVLAASKPTLTSTDDCFTVKVGDKTGYSYPVTVTFAPKAVKNYENVSIKLGKQVVATVSGAGTLAAPTNLTVGTVGYSTANLSWTGVGGANNITYAIYSNGKKLGETTDSSTSITLSGLSLGTKYSKVTVRAVANGTESEDSTEVEFTTKDLPASESFSVSDPSYSSVTGKWKYIDGADGYKIVSDKGTTHIFLVSTDALEPDEDGYITHTIAGLSQNKEYTFTIYGMGEGVPSEHGKDSNKIKTKKTNCEPQIENDITLKDCDSGGFNWDLAESDPIEVKKYDATVTFAFEAKERIFLGETFYPSKFHFELKESSDGATYTTTWYTPEVGSHKFDTDNYNKYHKGSTSVKLKKTTKYIKFVYEGNFCGKFTDIEITQGSYITVTAPSLNFGSVIAGTPVASKEISVFYSALVAGVSLSGNADGRFSIDKEEIGKNSCETGTEKVTLSANTEYTPGTYNGTLTIGENEYPISLTIQAIPKPELQVTNVSATSVSIIWNQVVDENTTYTVYKNGAVVASGVTDLSYQFTGLDQATQYSFSVEAVRGAAKSEMSDPVTPTTYSVLTIEKAGDYANAISFTVYGEDGNWNNEEISFAKGSKATVTASCSNTCAAFDKIMVGETEYTENPAEITINAATTATIYYTFKGFEKPEVTVSSNTSAYSISISWNEVGCADSYIVYNGSEEVATGVTETSYKFTGLDQATEYEFSVKAVRGEAESEVSEAVSATTYTTSMTTEITGIFGNKGTVSVTSTVWNEGEKSYAIGSKATVAVSSLPANCEVESIVANGVDVTTTAQFEVLAANSVVVTYHYTGSGIAEVVVDGEEGVIYETLTGAVDAADNGDIINLLGDVDDNMTVSEKSISFNGNGHKINNLYIKEDGNVELTGDVTVVQDFGLEISAENSGQFIEDGGQIEVKGKAYIDKTLDPSGVSKERIWYSVSVPFPVSYNDGVYLVDGNGTEKLLTFNKDFIIKEYDGDLRAASTTKPQGWVMPTTDDMVPGKFYLLGIARNGMNVFRFYKKSDAKLVTENKTLELKKHTSDNPLNAGWNGVGNSQLYHVGIEDATYRFAQALVGGKFVVVDFEKDALSVTTPMFIQTEEDGSVSLSKKSDGTLRSASAGSDIYNLRLTAEGESNYSDQMFASASSEATGNYTIGSDLAKFEISTAYPQIYTRAFNTNLCVHQAAYNEAGVAEMPLYLFAPAAGNYTLSLGSDVLDGTALVLVKDGAEIHNFNADGDYNLYLAKGTDSSYALRIKGENSDIATPVTDDKAENVKVYVKDGVLAIEGLVSGSSYAVGNVVRTLYSGVSNGADIKITLTEKGVYWVKAGEMSVKVLNK